MESPEERSSLSLESHLVKKLSTVPACRAILGYYDAIKTSNKFFELGLTYVETGVCTVVGNMTKNSWAGSTLDQYAGEGIEKLKVKFPILEKAPKKLMTKTKRKTMKKVKKGAATVFDTRIGRMFTFGLRTAVTMSENLLVGLQPHGRKSPRKPDKQNDGRKSEKTVQTEDGKKVMMVSSKEQQTDLSGADMIKQKMEAMVEEGPLSKLQMYAMEALLFPLELTVEFLRTLHGCIPGATKSAPSRKSTRKGKAMGVSPEKKMEIESRRKVSPKKRIQSSLLGNLKKVTCRVLGLGSSAKKQSDIRDFIKCSKHRGLNLDPAVEGDDMEKKRKHDDVSDGSASTDEDLMYMDLDDYESDEDPDYEPTDSSMSDISIESDEGESEGELETEKMDEEMYQLKEKDINKPPEVKAGQQPPKLDDKVQNSQKNDPNDPKTDPKVTKQDPKSQASPKPDQRSQAITKLDSKTTKSPSKDQRTPTTGPTEDKNKNDINKPPEVKIGGYPRDAENKTHATVEPEPNVKAEYKCVLKVNKQENKQTSLKA
ncbi:muscle M-line assembly protein unc-89-like [Pecten maximus]|uniref:muscle M-line assembly protein unc-89-like n=1 Tax=Pecten maximus TaxID=6579 RepID=UPI001458DA0C|nr:muscle M-line assembly protein unc-89-like [Pecten maximus]